MWKATLSQSSSLMKQIMAEQNNDPDEWDTDPDFVVKTHQLLHSKNIKLHFYSFKNDISEKEQRWGSKTVQGSGRQGFIE